MFGLMVFFVAYLLIVTLICVSSLGIGLLLHWVVPAIDVGIGTVIGVLAVCASFHFFLQLMAVVEGAREEQLELEWFRTGEHVLRTMKPGGSSRGKRRADRNLQAGWHCSMASGLASATMLNR